MLSSGVRPEQSFYDSVKKQETEKTNMYRLNQVAIRMVEMPPLLSDVPMDGPEAAVKVMADMLEDYDREVVAIVNLQTDGKPINMNVVSMGALDQSIAHPREILKSTILSNASAIMLVHNHPSNKLQPSISDWHRQDITGMQVIMSLISHARSTEKRISFTWYSRGMMTDMVLSFEQKRMIFGIELQEVKHSG